MTLTDIPSDIELMQRYEALRRQACGVPIGDPKHDPAGACQFEGWKIVRRIESGTNCPGTPVVALDDRERVWVVNDLDGPWAIRIM